VGDRRNVVDRYRYWTMEAIIADLDSRRHEFHVGIENWQHDFNIGTIVRTANAFLAKEVHIIGRRRWNRRGAMVTDRYQHVRHHESAADFAAYLHESGVSLLGIDNLPGSRPIESIELPRHCALLFGQEGPGLSDDARAACDGTFSIAQFGSTRSINASAAAAIAMHTWVRQHADLSADHSWRG
jgi:tRNA G18 (ribose-2'-O)-methylase SpoU